MTVSRLLHRTIWPIAIHLDLVVTRLLTLFCSHHQRAVSFASLGVYLSFSIFFFPWFPNGIIQFSEHFDPDVLTPGP